LSQAQRYLLHRNQGVPVSHELEAAWAMFYDRYLDKIRKYAYTCGATEDDIADCVQEVWTELLTRLPAFRLDPKRGKFDTWLFHIVRGKTADLRRAHSRLAFQENSDTLQAVIDAHPSPTRNLEEQEICTLAWGRLRQSLSPCNLQVLHMRLMEDRPVAEVADKLGLTHEQVWYRYHRARKEVEEIGSAMTNGRQAVLRLDGSHEKKEKKQESAQGDAHFSVSRTVGSSSRAHPGGPCVDYVFQRLELGRRELNPEWKVEWDCEGEPRPVLYIRKMAMVAYAEICGPGEFINGHWLGLLPKN
jgi:RNA polymerase sigma factor (sigma-70 family)